jgi:hypothetical protein
MSQSAPTHRARPTPWGRRTPAGPADRLTRRSERRADIHLASLQPSGARSCHQLLAVVLERALTAPTVRVAVRVLPVPGHVASGVHAAGRSVHAAHPGLVPPGRAPRDLPASPWGAVPLWNLYPCFPVDAGAELPRRGSGTVPRDAAASVGPARSRVSTAPSECRGPTRPRRSPRPVDRHERRGQAGSDDLDTSRWGSVSRRRASSSGARPHRRPRR